MHKLITAQIRTLDVVISRLKGYCERKTPKSWKDDIKCSICFVNDLSMNGFRERDGLIRL